MSKYKWQKLRKNKSEIGPQNFIMPHVYEPEEVSITFREPEPLNPLDSLDTRITTLENSVLDTFRPQGVLGVLENEGYNGQEIAEAIRFLVNLSRTGALVNLNALMGSPVNIYG